MSIEDIRVDLDGPVLVTGATGYVAGWLVRRLLENGATVHAAVRNPDRVEKRAHLDALAECSPGSIRYFAADLLDEGSYADAMEGCGTVFHTASPFVLNVVDPQRDLVDPALLGTRNVLDEATRVESVRRVVVTSSAVAIFGDNADVDRTAGGSFTEDDWNETSSLTHQPYSYSKTVAERAAWEIAESQDRWSMTTVNPHFVMGPGTSAGATSQSFKTLEQFADGSLRRGIPDFQLAMVDVRDVADMHLLAAFHPNASGRYLTFARSIGLLEVAEILARRFGGGYPFPTREIPRWIAQLVGPLVDPILTRRVVRRNVGIRWRGDNGKAVRDFGFCYRPIERAITDTFQQLIDSGRVPRK